MRAILILATAALLFASGCSPLSRREQVLFGLMVGAHLADYETTRQCLGRGGEELNPVIGGKPDRGSLALFKLGSVGVLWGLGELFPEHREGIYALGIAAGGGAAIHNSR